ncbi:hypothetical protein LCGC14_1694810 [marine sediment metagenome]|uniref:Uncharacterized protein n=1 Tax=marine sediment metagenome TaxID=412755 RepID=A0A0F9EDJ0_9ZZZZ
MGANKLRTIEEENERRAGLPVTIYLWTVEPRYEGTGIESPFGGEILQEVAKTYYGGPIPIKCSETGRMGAMQTDNSMIGIIKDVSWEGCSVVWVRE